jgi:cysteine desulfurase family protein (TIGR01976 family)
MNTEADGLLPASFPELLARPLAEQFPGLRPGTARFDGPGGTLVHAAVRDAMAAYLGSEHVANDHGAFPASAYSDTLVRWSADRVRALLGTPGGQVVYGANMTTLTTMFLRALAGTLQPGDEIICTELDHEANVAPWRALAAAREVVVRTAPIAPSGELPTDSLIELITPRTRWVAVTAASNALGTVPHLPAISAAAHAVGARVYMDGVQAVAHRQVDLPAWGCDAFVTSPYKWYGPHCGVLWLSDEVAQSLTLPEQVPSAGADLPGRIELGTTNFEAVLGTGVAAEVLLHWDRSALLDVEQKLTELLIAELAAMPEVRLLGPGPGPGRVPVVTFQIAGVPAEAVATCLARVGVSVWHGTFYAAPAIRALSPDRPEAVRAGLASYTTQDDVETLIRAITAVAKG